jgi:hypothetical protein
MNLGGGSTPEGLEEFVTVTSDFYHDLGPYYRALTDAWVAHLRVLRGTFYLVALIEKAIDTNTALAETGWGQASPFEFSPRGCIIDGATPTKLPSGEWLH